MVDTKLEAENDMDRIFEFWRSMSRTEKEMQSRNSSFAIQNMPEQSFIWNMIMENVDDERIKVYIYRRLPDYHANITSETILALPLILYHLTWEDAEFVRRNSIVFETICAEWFCQTADDMNPFSELLSEQRRAWVKALISSFKRHAQVSAQLSDLQASVDRDIDQMEMKLREAVNRIDGRIKSELGEQIQKARTDVALVMQNFDSVLDAQKRENEVLVSSVSEQFEKKIEDRVKEMAVTYAEKTKLLPTLEHWKSKISSHQRAAWTAFIAFGVLSASIVAGLMYSILSFPSEISAWISGINAAGTAIVIAPMLLIAWILRLISRVYVMNLIAAEDARHRKSISDTYLGLISEEGIVDQERIVALHALFRPAPGQPVDTELAPPSVLDLLKAKGT